MSPNTPAKRREKVEPGIYRRPDGHLEIGWRDATGRQRWKVIDGGIKAARNALAIEHAKRASGERVGDPRLRFNGAATAWWDAHVANLRPTTRDTYKSHVASLRQHFGVWRLANITADDIMRYIHAERARGAAGWTLRGRLTVLSGIFAYAIRRLDHPGSNPVAALTRQERPSIGDERPKRVLNADELEALIAHTDEQIRPLIDLMAHTGLRVGEALGLVWSDVDLTGELRITHQLDRQRRRVPPKTRRSARTVDISPQLAARLRAHRLACPATGDHGFVFVRRDGRTLERTEVSRAVRRAAGSAGLEGVKQGDEWVIAPITSHSLRHTHVSALIAAGWDVQEIADRAGDSVGTIMSEYAHQFDAARRAQSRRDRLSAMEAPMEASHDSAPQQTSSKVADLQAKRSAAQ